MLIIIFFFFSVLKWRIGGAVGVGAGEVVGVGIGLFRIFHRKNAKTG